MIRKCIEKINKFIHWTKKWHVFHLIAILSCLLIFEDIIHSIYNLRALKIFNDIILAPYNHILFFDFTIPISVIVSTIIMEIKYLKLNDIHVEKPFLLNNPIYNKFYISFYTYIIIGFVYFRCTYKYFTDYLEKGDWSILAVWLSNIGAFYSSIYFIVILAILIKFMNKRKEMLKRINYTQFSLAQNINNIIVFAIFAFLAFLPVLPILLVIYESAHS